MLRKSSAMSAQSLEQRCVDGLIALFLCSDEASVKAMKHDYWEIVQAMPAAEMADLMRRFEDLGLYGVWSPQLHAPPFPTMAAAAMATKRLALGSGIALGVHAPPDGDPAPSFRHP